MGQKSIFLFSGLNSPAGGFGGVHPVNHGVNAYPPCSIDTNAHFRSNVPSSSQLQNWNNYQAFQQPPVPNQSLNVQQDYGQIQHQSQHNIGLPNQQKLPNDQLHLQYKGKIKLVYVQIKRRVFSPRIKTR